MSDNNKTERNLPYIFDRVESDGKDINFSRNSGPTKHTSYALHADHDLETWDVLIFVRCNVSEKEIVHKVNKALTYWRKQTEIDFK